MHKTQLGLTIIFLLYFSPAVAQSDFTTYNPVGLFQDMEADTVTSDLFNHFAPTPDIAFTIVSPVPGESVCADVHAMLALDFDNDGDDDAIMAGPAFEGEPGARLLKNNGDGTFSDTKMEGLPRRLLYSLAGDFNNDGWTDVVGIVLKGGMRHKEWSRDNNAQERIEAKPRTGHLVFLINEEGKQFREIFLNQSSASVVKRHHGRLVAADFDQDGWLDFSLAFAKGNATYTILFYYGSLEGFSQPVPVLFEFDTMEWEINHDPSIITSCFDVDDDGDTDFIVQEEQFFPARSRKLMWWSNEGRKWSFQGDFPLPQRSRITALQQVDINNDGYYDLFAGSSDFHGGTNQLYVNSGDHNYVDQGKELGLWAGYSFTNGAVWGDWNNDTFLDLLQLRGFNESRYIESEIFLNERGERFLNISGTVEGNPGPGANAGLTMDVDQDGDLDILLSHRTDYFKNMPLEDSCLQLIRNDSLAENWLNVKLEGTTSNRSAIGARTVVFQGAAHLHQEVCNGVLWGISQPPMTMHFGLGKASAVDSVQVFWPNGDVEFWGRQDANQRVIFTEGQGESRFGK